MERSCSVEGCGDRHEARGLCNKHYQHAYQNGTLPPKKERPKVCSEDGCAGKPFGHGLCNKHYKLVYRAKNDAKLKEQARALRAAKPEVYREYERRHYDKNPARKINRLPPGYRLAWQRANPARMREYESIRRHREKAVDPQGWIDAVASGMQSLPCACCLAPGPSEIDHVIPLRWIDDAPHLAEHLGDARFYQPLCRGCNASKGARHATYYGTDRHVLDIIALIFPGWRMASPL